MPTQTVNSKTYDFYRTGFGVSTGVYQTADGLDRLTFEHTVKARARHAIRLDRLAIVEDPLSTGSSFEAGMSATLAVNMPKLGGGFDAADADWLVKLLSSILNEGTPDYSLRFLRGEV
jgi:hypothetical protein